MRTFNVSIALMMIFIASCITTNKTLDEIAVKTNFDGSPVEKSATIAIYFTGGFNDSFRVKQNKTVLKEGFFKSDWSTSYTGVVIRVDFKSGDKVEVVELSSGKKIIIKLINGYRIVEVSKYSNEWAVLYTNRNIVFE